MEAGQGRGGADAGRPTFAAESAMRVWDMSLLQDNLPEEKPNREHIYNYVDSEENRRRIDRRFTRLQHLLTAGLILCFLAPNTILLAYFIRHFREPLERGAEQDPAALAVAAFVCISLLVTVILYHAIGWLMRGARRMAGQESRLQEMLAHASRLASIGELAAGVAHEINNPLAIIMAESGVIRDMFNPEFDLDHSPEALYKELDVIDRAADRAKGITKRLQEMGKTGRERSEPCDLNGQLRLVLERLRKLELKGKNLDVRFEPAPELPPVLAEAERLRQVFANILVNAADAIGDAPGRITVTTALAGDKAAVRIEDTGRGIPPENLERIFHPFFTTKGGGRGTGLGLSIAASIVKTLGGVIKVKSRPGEGSVFTVLLPGEVS